MKVLIYGYYGFKNLGDELILSKIIEDIKSIDSKAEITVCTGDVDYTRRIHGISGINRFSPDALEDAVKDSDVVVVGGGGLMHEYFGIDIKDIFNHFGYKVAAYAIPALMAKSLQKPVFYWCHGVGPIFTEEGRNFTRWFYTLSDFTTLRDEDSYAILKKIYPEVKNVYIDTDPVMSLDVSRFVKPLPFEFPQDRVKIGINIRPWLGIEGIIENISAALRELYEENKDIVIVPIPFDLDLSQDQKILRKLVASMPEGSVFEYGLEKLETPEEVISLMNRIDFFIGMRLHSIIVSSLLKIPTLSISYDLKTDKFADILKIPVIRIEELTKDNMLVQLRSLLNTDRKDLNVLQCNYKTPEFFKNFIEGKNLPGITGMEVNIDRSGKVTDTSKNEVLTYENFIKSPKAELNQTIAEKNNLRNQLNNIYSSDFWKVASLYYRVRDNNPIFRSVYKIAKKLKSSAKNSKYLYYLSRFRDYSRQYGIKEALRRSYRKIRNKSVALGMKKIAVVNKLKNILNNKVNNFSSQLTDILKNTPDRKGIIIYASIIDWNFPLFQRPQQLAMAFSKKGFLVFYCTPNYRYDNYVGFHKLAEYLYVCKVKPEVFVNAGIEPAIIINWPTNKDFIDSLASLNKKVIYDYIDHIEILPNYNENILNEHIKLIKESDVVTVTADNLYSEAKKYRDNIILCPNGVDIEHFKDSGKGYPEEIEDILRQGKPIIGYSGALAKWFDYDLIAYCAGKRPDYTFLLLGYEHDESYKESGLAKIKNVLRVGPVDYSVLPEYLKSFDVAIIPFKINSTTSATSPVKLFEYAACKKPIVTTELPECKKYEVVLVSKSGGEFLKNIDMALELKTDAAYLEKLEKLTRENTWDARVEIMIKALNASPLKQVVKEHSYDIISFPIMPWVSRFQRSQQLLTKFSSNGVRVFRVNTAFLVDSKSYALDEVRENILHVTLNSGKGLSVYKDHFDDDSLNKVLQSIECLRIDHLISNAICIVELPFWYPLVKKLKHRYGWKIVYDCMDEHEGFSTNEGQMLSEEAQLAKESDLLVVTAKYLYDKMIKHNKNCIAIPNATDFEHFSYLPENDLLKDIPKPIIGYYGAISGWFDNAMVEYVANTRRDWNFILIGNTFGADISILEKLPNVRLLGEKPYSELPKYLYWFDVCIIPFKLNKLTEATNPVKFFEFISSGKPVVSTRLPELVALKDYLYIADSREDFVEKIATALEENRDKIRQSRIKLAMNNTWDKRYKAMNAAICKLYPKVSIIIVTYNNVELTKACIDSIYLKSQYPHFEIIIVDNDSHDGTIEYLHEISRRHKNIKLILNDDNKGFATANNQGIKIAEGDYIILLNNDTVVTPGWITRLLRYLEDKNIGMVGPVTNMCGNEAKISVPYNVSTLKGFEKFIKEYYKSHPEQDYFEIDMLGMFCVALRKETVDEIGLLDEMFKVGTFEDTDYAQRLKLEGYKIICARDVFIHHHCNASFGKLPPEEYLRIYAENKRKFEEKWGVTVN